MKSQDPISFNAPLEEVTFVALDVETTGLNPYLGDRICEIALLKFRERQTLASFNTLINPGRPISPGAQAVNGISDEMVAYAPRFDQVVDQVQELLAEGVILAHNAPFDLSFLAVQLRALGLPPLDNPVVDTLTLAKRCYRFPSNSLESIAIALKVDTSGQHRALGDARMAQEIFGRFLEDFRRWGVKTLGDLLDLQGGLISFPAVREVVLPPEIDEIIRSGKKLLIRYLSTTGQETVRVVEPLEVNAFMDNLYLIAFCHLRQEQRTFRLDRILEMRPVEE